MGTFVIAEAGVNHNGDLARAIELVDVAAHAGADAVKFQTFNAELLTTERAALCAYQEDSSSNAKSQREMLAALELDADAFRTIAEHCAGRGIEFMSTAFDPGSLRFLIDELGIARIKIPSGEIVNPLLLLPAARSGLPIIVSTGLATLEEVTTAVEVLRFGMREPEAFPRRVDLLQVETARHTVSPAGAHITVLQCVSNYPAEPRDSNLRAMQTLSEQTGCAIGLSDHTPGVAVSIAAVALGAGTIEKHITLDKSLPGPDHQASLDPQELTDLIRGIRQTEVALGDGIKRPSQAELANLVAVRGSVVARQEIAPGSLLTLENLTVKRPGDGLDPMSLLDAVGTTATRGYAIDDQIDAAGS